MKCEEVLFLLSTMFIAAHGEDGSCASAANPKKIPDTVEGHLKHTIRSLWQTEILAEQTKDIQAFFLKELLERDAQISNIKQELAEKNEQISALLTKTNNLETKINHLEETKETTPRPANPRRNCKNAYLVDTEENCDLTYVSLHFLTNKFQVTI